MCLAFFFADFFFLNMFSLEEVIIEVIYGKWHMHFLKMKNRKRLKNDNKRKGKI